MARIPFQKASEMTAEAIQDIQGDKTATEVQFAFCSTLEQRGFCVVPELRLPSRYHVSGAFLADLAILDDTFKPLGLIECKSDGVTEVTGNQRKAYDDCGLPWVLGTIGNHQEVLAWAEQFPKCRRSA